jgi:hypothetical protein
MKDSEFRERIGKSQADNERFQSYSKMGAKTRAIMTRLPCRLIAEAAQVVGKGVFCGTVAMAGYARWGALPGFQCGPGPGSLGALTELGR